VPEQDTTVLWLSR